MVQSVETNPGLQCGATVMRWQMVSTAHTRVRTRTVTVFKVHLSARVCHEGFNIPRSRTVGMRCQVDVC